MKQATVGWQLGISWTICKSCASHSREITMPATHHSFFYRLGALLMPNQQCQNTHTHTEPFYGHFSGTTRVSWCQKKSSCGLYGAREDNRGRHTDNPAGRHSIRTNQPPTSIIPPFLCRMPFLLQPSQFILAWDRHQICWFAYWLAWFNSVKALKATAVVCELSK